MPDSAAESQEMAFLLPFQSARPDIHLWVPRHFPMMPNGERLYLQMLELAPALQKDVGGITDIYNHYIVSSVATFEENRLSEEQVQSRIDQVTSASLPWLVAREVGGPVIGYCYARPWHQRSAYRFSVETSLYVSEGFTRQGIGSRLYELLLQMLREGGFHTAIGGISLPNAASVALHEKFGFGKVAHYTQVGRKFGRWVDVGYWQLLL